MNDDLPSQPRLSMPRTVLHLTLIALLAVVVLGGLDALVKALVIGAIVLYFAGWDQARARAAARDLGRYMLGTDRR